MAGAADARDSLFVVQMAGDSMRIPERVDAIVDINVDANDGKNSRDGGIRDGDLLIVDRSCDPRPGDVVVAVLDGELAVKRLLVRGSHTILHADNPRFPDYMTPDGVRPLIWGVVLEVLPIREPLDVPGTGAYESSSSSDP